MLTVGRNSSNIERSFRSGRYFGRANESVRKTGIVAVRPQTADDFTVSML